VSETGRNQVVRFVTLLIHRYLRHRVGVQSAALAFYLLFMLFPFLIFISALLGMLQLNVAAVLGAVEEFLPREVLEVLARYLNHVGETPNPRLMFFGLVFSVYFPMRATNTLMRAVRTACHLGPPRNTVRHILKTLLYTGLLMVTIMLTLVLATVSDRLLAYGVQQFRLPVLVAQLWTALRFPLIGAVGFFALLLLYALAQDVRQPWKNLWPGTLTALGVWLGLSWAYTWYVEHVAHYSLLYGSIGAVIVLLIWLNMTAVVLIMGAEWNGVWMGLRKEQLAGNRI